MEIRQNAFRGASLVQHLLAFSRQQPQNPKLLDLGESLVELRETLQRLMGENIKLDLVDRPNGLWPVKADQTQFAQVIFNLAVNAKDAMPEGGRLTFRIANVTAEQSRELADDMTPGEYVLVEVTDTGTGIPPEIKERVFEPFFTTKEVGKGTGLGLSTVYGIVKQTGGFVYLDSTAGKGTKFRIFLPRHLPAADETSGDAPQTDTAAPPAVRGAAPAEPVLADDTGRGTILLVEDEEGLRRLNARALESRGYTVLQAANGVEAMEAFERYPSNIDVVVSDVKMPEMDGPTLLTRLRSLDPNVKIIFVSGYAEGEAFEKVEGQKYNFLAKPFSLKQLIGAVKENTGM